MSFCSAATLASTNLLSSSKTSPIRNKVPMQLALLYQDSLQERFVRVYGLLLDQQMLSQKPIFTLSVSETAHMIVPFQNLLIVIEQSNILLIDTKVIDELNVDFQTITCYDLLGNNKFILGDDQGVMWILSIQSNKLKCDRIIGENRVIGTSLSSINEYTVYVGSHFGNSMLLSIDNNNLNEMKDINHTSSNAQLQSNILESFINLAPIVDFCIVDIEKQGQVYNSK